MEIPLVERLHAEFGRGEGALQGSPAPHALMCIVISEYIDVWMKKEKRYWQQLFNTALRVSRYWAMRRRSGR